MANFRTVVCEVCQLHGDEHHHKNQLYVNSCLPGEPRISSFPLCLPSPVP